MSSFPASNEQEAPRLTPAVQGIIAISVAVAFLQAVGVFPYATVASWFGFDSGLLPARWWTTVTYMFVHVGIWHLVANMYGLYLFGPRLEYAWGSKRFTWFYLFGALGGVVFQMLFIR